MLERSPIRGQVEVATRVDVLVGVEHRPVVELDPDDDAAYDLVIAVASGSLDEIEEIARILGSFVSIVE